MLQFFSRTHNNNSIDYNIKRKTTYTLICTGSESSVISLADTCGIDNVVGHREIGGSLLVDHKAKEGGRVCTFNGSYVVVV